MSTTTTTIDPFFYDPFDFDPFDYDLDNFDPDNYDLDNYDLSDYYDDYLDAQFGEKRNDDYRDISWERFSSLRNTVAMLKSVVCFIGIVVNVLHFFILTRRGLRHNFVFIIMMGISICDIFLFLNSPQNFLFGETFEYSSDDCIGAKPYRFMLTSLITMALEAIGRKCSVLLALAMAAFRTSSIMFPMSDTVQDLSTARSAVLLIVVVAALSAIWESGRFLQYEIVELEK